MAALRTGSHDPEPHCSAPTFSIGNELFIFRGILKSFQHKANAELPKHVEVFDSKTLLWKPHNTVGELPSWYQGAAVTTFQDRAYFLGGDCGEQAGYCNEIFTFNSKSFEWMRNQSTDQILRIVDPGLVALPNGHLVTSGGFAESPTSQSTASFTPDPGHPKGRGHTDQFLHYNPETGQLSTPLTTGKTPPPSGGITLTRVDRTRAIWFGGLKRRRTNEMFILDTASWHWTGPILPQRDQPWPEERAFHTAFSLLDPDTDPPQPCMVMIGGESDTGEPLGDVWLFHVNVIQWEKVLLPPESLTPRWEHGGGVIHLTPTRKMVVVVAGISDNPRKYVSYHDYPLLSDTTVLEFECKGEGGGSWTLNNVLSGSKLEEERQRRQRKGDGQDSAKVFNEPMPHVVGDHESQHSEHQGAVLDLPHIVGPTHVQPSIKYGEKLIQELTQWTRTMMERAEEAEKCIKEREERMEEAEDRASKAEERVSEEKRRSGELKEQLMKMEGRCGEEERRSREAEEQLLEEERRSREMEGQLREMEGRWREADQARNALQQQLEQKEDPFWMVERGEIHLTEQELGSGGWATVKVAEFRGLQVAAKCLHKIIISDYNRQLFMREMSIAAKLRHPNLIQFIGATLEGEPIILTELMETSLRSVLEREPLNAANVTSISHDIARALNYLHLTKPDPIVHRDVSSANVLLNLGPNKIWLAKLSDYGSANFVQRVTTAGPGNAAYAAPEASIPSQQTPKMDVYSYGILLVEMATRRFPDKDTLPLHIQHIQDPGLPDIIQRCIQDDPARRPNISDVLTQLKKICTRE